MRAFFPVVFRTVYKASRRAGQHLEGETANYPRGNWPLSRALATLEARKAGLDGRQVLFYLAPCPVSTTFMVEKNIIMSSIGDMFFM